MERMSEHTGLINSYQLLIIAACTNTGGKMKGSHSRAADRCPFVPRHSLSQVTSFVQLGMLWFANAGYWKYSKLNAYYEVFGNPYSLEWQSHSWLIIPDRKMCANSEKHQKIRLLICYTVAVLSVICYSCREESVTRLVRNHKARYRVP